ncbi:ABC transporter related [Beutenbergia cavernae DSM 12333]|uniref:ABC transporter related n=1 Tax=Beutenbergia cavernae (strain ATCC BAA-8 / DSM 12333 / CCUG 43141 / JCM 11478 / NBRC 16432 / NCIMB 13614 / HKI 0122) TaxID=471853 RepID=C5BZV6_BEUC1|nr:ABC transporter ATP-binding protein [Beutenbergia cavernae]ACQ81286.1 ABC transporter related [Beutenbergia cavernae DSM 12333]
MNLPVADGAALRARTAEMLREHRGGLTRVVLLHIVAATAGLAGPWLLGRIVDDVAGGTNVAAIDQAVLILVVAVIAQTIFVRYAQRASMILGESVFADLRESFIQTVTSLPLSTVERAGTGDLVARTTNDIDRVQYTVRFGVPRVLVAVSTILLTVTAGVLTNWTVALAMFLGVPLLVAGSRWYLKRATPAYLRESAAYATINGTITESVEGSRTTDALSLGARRRARMDADIDETLDAERKTLYLRTWLFPAIDSAFVLPMIGVLVWGAYLVSTGHATLGAVTTIALYSMQVIGPIGELIFWLDEIQVGTVSLARIFGVSDVPADRTATDEQPEDEHLVAQDVRYAYREGVNVLHGIDLDLGVGERLAIVGPSGAGKSTFGRMLAGIHPPTGGTVKVGGVDLVDLPLEDLRSHVALVTQEHHVFVGTLAENLRLAKVGADDAELERALDAVDALGWARALPDGLETEVGSGGAALTPAQAQQIALARLVLLDPHTLVLDEATSLLDPRAARHLESSLAAVLEGRTVVAIAHRLYTAHDADRVAVIEEGRIAEIGSHDELVVAGREYAALWHSWQQD